jgi:hypothetical protein
VGPEKEQDIMSTLADDKVAASRGVSSSNRTFAVAAILAIVVGLGAVLGGLGGLVYTWRSAAVENIDTPDDAVFAGVPVRGPMSMWAQQDIITKHQLDRTGGLRYAEMPSRIPQLDEAGQPVIGDDGEPVLVPNADRLSWINATALTSVLNLGIMAYMLSLFAIVMGASVAGLGWVVLRLSRNPVSV